MAKCKAVGLSCSLQGEAEFVAAFHIVKLSALFVGTVGISIVH